MTRDDLLISIVTDLGANYREDDIQQIGELLDEVINDALSVSNRKFQSDLEAQLSILASNIRRCVKSIYLQRGAEDTSSQSLAGVSSSYDDAMARMRADIILTGKRIMIWNNWDI